MKVDRAFPIDRFTRKLLSLLRKKLHKDGCYHKLYLEKKEFEVVNSPNGFCYVKATDFARILYSNAVCDVQF